MSATFYASNNTEVGRMRPLNMMRDLPSIADLIELCFSSTLDPEGRSYIDQMRRNGRDSSFLSWAPRVIDTVSLPLSGFVWESKGRVVGNVSLIPFVKNGKKIFLIANVATHPDFRRHGIARQLTAAAMEKAREKKAQSIWLHVREDNPGAIQLYHNLGFVERSRRTSWHTSIGAIPSVQNRSDIQISPRSSYDWPIQNIWLERAYPAAISWYTSHNLEVFKPGLLNAFYRLITDSITHQWSAHRAGSLLGVLSYQHNTGYSGQFWAAMPEHAEPAAMTNLLLHGRSLLSPSMSISMEYPSGSLDESIRAAGFSPQRTLVWMQAAGSATF